MYRIYTAGSLPEAHIVHHILAEAHIEAEVFHANAGGALGELPVTYPEVWVRHERDRDRAQELVDSYEKAGRQPQATHHCENCGETNPGTFELCWNCQETL